MQKGFNLSEILITLGVIGVVAAMTLQSLINTSQKFVLKQQFKKSLNVISNAVRDTYSDLEYTPHCSYNLNDGTTYGTMNDCITFNNALIKNLKTIKYCQNKALEKGCIANIKGLDTIKMSENPNLSEEDARNSYKNLPYLREYEIHNSNPAWILADGQVFMLFSNGRQFPIYLVDINGLKGPNKWGYDIYTFVLSKYTIQCQSSVIEKGGISCSKLMLNNP